MDWEAIRSVGRLMNREPSRDRELFRVVLNDEGDIEVYLKVSFDDEDKGQRLANLLVLAVMRTCSQEAFREFTAMNFTKPGRA